MSDSEIIFKFLNREYQDDHVAIYLYCCGNVSSQKTAIDFCFEFTKNILCPGMPEWVVKHTVKTYLKHKKKQYQRAEIKIKPIY